MDVSHLKLELLDFSNISQWRWRLRRIVLGFLLFFYYTYAFLFFLALAAPTQTQALVRISETDHLLITATFGFLGSIFFVTRTFIRTVQKRDLPVVWYIARPLQGTLMAVFVYYAFRAGQLVFYSAGGEAKETAINVWTISVLAILAGVFAEEAYEGLYSVATRLFKSRQGT